MIVFPGSDPLASWEIFTFPAAIRLAKAMEITQKDWHALERYIREFIFVGSIWGSRRPAVMVLRLFDGF